MAELSKQDLALVDRIRDEFNAQPRADRLRAGRFMSLEAVMELLRERQHAQATVTRIEARIATILAAERRREPEVLAGVPAVGPADPCPQCERGGVCKTPACGRLRSSELMRLYGGAKGADRG